MNINLFKLIFVLLFSFLLHITNAQQLQKIAEYNTKDGLYNNAVTSIYKDANGYFWLKAYHTLQRWNGNSFFGEPERLNPNEFLKIASDKSLQYFVTDETNMGFIVNEKSNLFVSNNAIFSESTTPLNKPIVDEFSNLCTVVKKNTGINIYTFLRNNQQMVIKTKNGFIILAINGNIYYANLKTGCKQVNIPNINAISKFIVFGDKLLLIYQQNRAYAVLQNDSILYKGYLPTNEIGASKIIDLQLSTDDINRFALLSGKSLIKITLEHNNSISIKNIVTINTNEKISSFYYDEEKNTLLIGTYDKGFIVYQLSNKKFNYEFINGTEKFSYSHLVYHNSIINNIKFYQQYQSKIYNFREVQPSVFCSINSETYIFFCSSLSIYTISKNKLFTKNIQGIIDGLIRFYVKTDSVIYLSSSCLNTFYTNANAFINGNIISWPTLGKQLFAIAASPQPNTIYAIIGSELQALNMHTKTSTTLAKGIVGEPRCIDIDSANNALFISSKYNGCYYYKNNRLTQLPFTYNKLAFNPHYVLQDKEGDFWLPTNEGLFFMYNKDFRSYISGKTKAISFKRFGKEDGILNEEFNGGFQQSGLLYKDSIVMASMAGSVMFHPSLKNKTTLDEGQLVLDYIKVDDEKISNIAKIELQPNFKLLKIKTDFPFIYTKGNLEHRIMGSNDTNWLALNATGLLEIKNLVAGNYVIEIRPSIDNTKSIAIRIKVKPFWYKTWWAYCILTTLILASCYIIFKWRWHIVKNKNLALINDARINLFNTIAHDLRSPINNYIGLADDIKHLVIKKEYEKIDIIGNQLDEKSRKLNLLVSNVLNWSSIEKGISQLNIKSLVILDIINEILPAYYDIASARNIKINSNIDGAFMVKSDENIIALMLRNLIDNAIKFSVNGSIINIKCSSTENKKLIEISNPILPTQQQKILIISNIFKGEITAEPNINGLGLGIGIASIQSSRKLINATIDVEVINSSVTFSLRIPD